MVNKRVTIRAAAAVIGKIFPIRIVKISPLLSSSKNLMWAVVGY
jgi:hypothetical protein